MNCTKCNAPIPEGSKFCTVCGQKVEIPAAPAAPAAKFCPNCGKQLAEGARFCASCGAATEAPAAPVAAPAPVVEPAPAPQPVPQPAPAPQPVYQPAPQPVYQPVYQAPVATAAPKKKSKVGLIIAVVVIALALVGGVVAGFATDWFGLAAPSYVDEDDDDDKGNGKADLDGDEDKDNKPGENDDQPGGTAISGSGALADVAQSMVETVEEGNFTMYLSFSDGYDTYYVDLYTDSNFRSQDFLFDAKVYSNDMEMELAYYDGYLIASVDGELHALKVTPQQLLQYAQESNPAAGMGMNALNTIHSFEDILDLVRQNMDSETLAEIEEAIDFDVLLDCLETLGRNLQDNAWLEDNLALETTRDGNVVTYTFDNPDLGNLVGTLLEMFTPVFKNDEDADSITESLDAIKPQLRGIDLYMSFVVSDGMLTESNFSIAADGEEIAANITVADINNTEVDTDRLQDLLDDAEIEYFEDLFQEQGDPEYEDYIDSDIAVEIA